MCCVRFVFDFVFLKYRTLRKIGLSENKMNIFISIWLSFLVYTLIIVLTKQSISSSNIIDMLKTSHASLLLLPLGIFWQLDSIYGNKWRYCANLYNKHLEHKTFNGKKYCKVRKDFFIATLCTDIYEMRLEHDSQFEAFFFNVLENAKKKANESVSDAISRYQEELSNKVDELNEKSNI